MAHLKAEGRLEAVAYPAEEVPQKRGKLLHGSKICQVALRE
jgi:hypothetical protein